MIRLTALLVRNPSLSREEFVDHWHNVHGPLIRDTPTLARHLLRYEQHPMVDLPGVGLGDFDGVAVQWLESMDSLTAFMNEPAYREQVRPDEEYLLDFDNMKVTFTTEPILLIGHA